MIQTVRLMKNHQIFVVCYSECYSELRWELVNSHVTVIGIEMNTGL